MTRWLAACLLLAGCAAAPRVEPLPDAPFGERALAARARAFAAARAHPHHLWRDFEPETRPGRVRGYVEIGLGDREKRELSIADNRLVVDRVIAEDLGGYPVNYGFVPGTLAYDGDPLDVLVLGPRLEPGTWVEGVILGVLHMEDDKGVDPKVVVATARPDGQPALLLTGDEKARLGAWFARYKSAEIDRFSKVTGWGDPEDARRILADARGFFMAGMRLDADRGDQ